MYTVVGIIGATLILFGFYRISIGRWTGKSLWYEIDNFFGAILIGIYQLHHKAYISLVINIVWAVVAFRGLSSYAERQLRARK
jgi:hypothetical protein